MVGFQISNFPADLKAKLVAEADRSESNMTDIAVGRLAKAFRVSYEGTGRRGGPVGDSAHVLFEMPRELRKRISLKAAEKETTMRLVAIDTLYASYRNGG